MPCRREEAAAHTHTHTHAKRTHTTNKQNRIDEQLKKLDAQLMQFKEQIKRTRPGPAQEALKRRALTVRSGERRVVFARVMMMTMLPRTAERAAFCGGTCDACLHVVLWQHHRLSPPAMRPRSSTHTDTLSPPKTQTKQQPNKVLKQKRMYEGQRDTLYAQQFNMEQVCALSLLLMLLLRAAAACCCCCC